MSKLYCALGRTGDLLSQIPLLYSDFQKTGIKSQMLVAKEFAPVLDGCSYIEPVIFDGDYCNLEGAVKLAQTLSDDVVVTSIHGTKEAVEKYAYSQIGKTGASTSNFQFEQWKLARRLNDWYDNLPLVFDQRSPERECRLLDASGFKKSNRKPVLLLAVDGGHTAPFPYSALLKDYVRAKFGKDYRILDLPMVEKPDGRVFDLLAVMEQSDLLITIDSMPLHLAWACRDLPVFALTNDRDAAGKPSLWHGSPWRPNHLWYCRYHDWPARAVEMCEAIEDLSDGYGVDHVDVWVGSRGSGTCAPFSLPVSKGMWSRELNGCPFVKDVVRMACQRASNPETLVQLSRDSVTYCITDIKPFYAYRLHNGQYSPIVDLFSAPKSFWRVILLEIPDLVLDNDDPLWAEALCMIFRKYGAKDMTGCCEFVKEEK